MSVKAPYHFVPLSKWTCLPDWSAQISHDRPFADGISGQLKIKIEANSPLLIGGLKDKDDNIEFIKDPDNKPYIPGASLRGMIRNVMEIATFGDMIFLDDSRFGVRDISKAENNYSRFYKKHSNITGWLKFDGRNWIFNKTDYYEVPYDELDRINPLVDVSKYDIDLCYMAEEQNYKSELKKQKDKVYRNKTGYQLKVIALKDVSSNNWTIIGLNNQNKCIVRRVPKGHTEFVQELEKGVASFHKSFVVQHALKRLEFFYDKVKPIKKYNDFPLKNTWQFTAQDDPSTDIELSNSGSETGHMVFVGSMDGKTGDYIFCPPGADSKTVPLEVFRDFQISHKEYGEQYQINPKQKLSLFEFLVENQHPQYGIPVFALVDKKSEEIKVLGLAKMMKIAAPYGIHYLYNRHKFLSDNDMSERQARRVDMVQGIFGMTRDVAGYSLKSRVSFSDAKLTHECPGPDYGKTVLGGPKAAYFPAYLEQETDREQRCKHYNDYLTPQAQLSGWKRYPVRKGRITRLPAPPNDNSNVAVGLKPLGSGTSFEATIRFHNLKTIELGALLWALDFGAEENTYHKLGMAKPLGFGQVQLHIKGKEPQYTTFSGDSLGIEELVKKFSDYMNEQYQLVFSKDSSWSDSPQIKNLLAMAHPAENTSNLEYMSLSEYTKSTNSENEKALLPYQNIARQEPVISFSRGSDNYRYVSSSTYGIEIREQLAKEDREKQKKEEELQEEKRQEKELGILKKGASPLTQEVLEAIAQHKKSNASLDEICKRLTDEKNIDLRAIQEFLNYLSTEKTGKQWIGIKQRAKKEKRRAWISLMEKNEKEYKQS